MRKRHYHILTILAAMFGLAGCWQSEQEPVDEGLGTVVLKVGTIATRGTTITSADGDDDSSPDDGDKMTSLSVWLVKGEKVYKFTNMNMSTSPAETAECNLGSCARGDYKLYVVANCKDLDSYGNESTLDADFKDKEFELNSAGSSPAYSTAGALAKVIDKSGALFTDKNGGMPLSYVGDVAVGPGKNEINVELDRVCARFTVKITNNAIGKKVCINKVTLSSFNPLKGYLFPHTDESGHNKVPFSKNEEVAFPDVTDNNFAIIQPGKSMVLSDLYLFETYREDDKEITIRGALYNDGVEPSLASGSITTYTLDGNTSSVNSGNRYLIRSSSSSTYYLGTDGSSVRLWSFPNDTEIVNSPDIGDFIWVIIGGSGSYTFYNEKYKVYLTITASTVTVGVSNNRSYLNYNNKNIYYYYSRRTSYYLTNSSNKPSVVNNNPTQWDLRKVTSNTNSAQVFDNNKEKDIFFHSSITHVDQYGVPFLLSQLKRNQHLQMEIGVTYSEATGNFDFQLVNWDNESSETTFD